MERVVRLLALVALFTLFVAGCGKDTVTTPGGETAVATDGSTDGGTAGARTNTGGATAETGGPEGTGSTGANSVASGDDRPSSGTSAPSSGTTETQKAGAGEVVLRYNLEKGEKYSYEMKSVMEAMGRSVTVVTNLAASVVDVKGDKFTVEYEFGEAKVTASDPQTKSLIEQQMAAMKGTTVTADIDRRGQMTNVKGAGAEMLQGMGSLGFVFPEKALKVGDSWTHTVDVQGASGAAPVKVNFKLTGVSGSVVTLAGSGTHTMDMSPPGGQQQGGAMSVQSTFTTTSKVDITSGMIIESNGTLNTKVSGPGMGGLTQKVTVTVKRK